MILEDILLHYEENLDDELKHNKKTYWIQIVSFFVYMISFYYLPISLFISKELNTILISILFIMISVIVIRCISYKSERILFDRLKQEGIECKEPSIMNRYNVRELYANFRVKKISDFLYLNGINSREELNILISKVKKRAFVNLRFNVTLFSALYIPVWIQVVNISFKEVTKLDLISNAIQFLFIVLIICFSTIMLKSIAYDTQIIFLKPARYKYYRLYQSLEEVIITN